MFIKKNDYFNWINLNKNLSDCQKKILIEYRNNLNKIYVSKKSNIQIYTLINYCWNNNLVTKMAKIKTLFYAFFNKKFTEILISKILSIKEYDTDLINFIIESKNKNNIYPEKNNIYKICDSWTFIIQNMSLIIKNKLLVDQNEIIYLDVGCGSGNKTNKFGRFLNIYKNNIYGADISKWGPYNQKKYSHNFNFIKIHNDDIDLDSNKVNFCTCILMLHHVEKIEELMMNIKRIIKPNGILLLIEHNNFDDIDNLTLDVLHLLYGYLYDKNNRYLAQPDYAQYHNLIEWNYLMNKFDFEVIETNSLFTELSNDIRYDNIFYSFYKNIK